MPAIPGLTKVKWARNTIMEAPLSSNTDQSQIYVVDHKSRPLYLVNTPYTRVLFNFLPAEGPLRARRALPHGRRRQSKLMWFSKSQTIVIGCWLNIFERYFGLIPTRLERTLWVLSQMRPRPEPIVLFQNHWILQLCIMSFGSFHFYASECTNTRPLTI